MELLTIGTIEELGNAWKLTPSQLIKLAKNGRLQIPSQSIELIANDRTITKNAKDTAQIYLVAGQMKAIAKRYERIRKHLQKIGDSERLSNIPGIIIDNEDLLTELHDLMPGFLANDFSALAKHCLRKGIKEEKEERIFIASLKSDIRKEYIRLYQGRA